MQTRRALLASLAAAAAYGNLSAARAQDYPSRAIRIVVPTTPGGPSDTVGRIMAEGMRASLGQPVLIENVPGASGSLGVGRLAKAAPDGYTVGLGNMAWSVFNGATYDLPYDLRNDFDPVSLIADDPMVLVARKDLEAKDLKGLIAWLQANPGTALAGTGGVGSTGHVFGLDFQQTTRTDFRFIPFRGFAEVGTELMAGRIDLAIGPAGGFVSHVRAGTMRAYAVFAKARLADMSEVPTADEAGVPGLFLSSWHGFFVPKGTPKIVVSRLNAATVSALNDPAVRRRLVDIGQSVFPPEDLTPERLRVYQQAGIEKWWPVIKAAGIRAE